MYTNQNVFICSMLMFCRGLPRKFNLSNFRNGPWFVRDNEIRSECLKGARRMKIWRLAWEDESRGGPGFPFSMGQDLSDCIVWVMASSCLCSPFPQLIKTTKWFWSFLQNHSEIKDVDALTVLWDGGAHTSGCAWRRAGVHWALWMLLCRLRLLNLMLEFSLFWCIWNFC